MWSLVNNLEAWLNAHIAHDALIAIPALFVALLIPIAFFLMERQDLYGFDKNVILDKIIIARISIPLVVLASIALVFDSSILATLLCALLLIAVIVVLVRVYKWMTAVEVLKHKNTYKQDMRLRFIRSIKNETEKVDTWAIILNDENLMEKNQRGIVAEFIVAVRSLEDGKNRYPKSNLLGLMSRNVNKIDFSDVNSYEDLVTFSITYFEEMRSARITNKATKNKDHRVSYPSHYQMELALNLLKLALDKKINDIFDYLYFSSIKKYLASGNVDEASFSREFLPSYINIVKGNEGYDAKTLWQELSDWVITKELLSSQSSWSKTIALLNAYMSSVGNQTRLGMNITRHEAEVVDAITEQLLPNINVSFWFDIITFYNSGWGLDEGEDSLHGQIRGHVSRRREFGLFNALGGTGYWVDDEEERLKAYREELERQDGETIFILGLVYPWLRNPVEIKKVIKQIQVIQKEKLFEAESNELRRLESLLGRFEKIKAYTDNMIAEQNKKKTPSKKS